MTSPEDKRRLQQLIDANPAIQAAINQAGTRPDHRYDWATIVGPALKQSGITLPDDVGMLTNGELYDRSLLQRNPWIVPAIGIAAGVTGGAALGAFSGGAPTAGAVASSPMVSASPMTAAASALGPGEGLGSLGQIGVPSMLSNAGVPAAQSAASTLPGWVKPVTALAGPPIAHALTGGGGTPGTGGAGFGADQSAQLNQLMQLLIQRAQETAPVHQLAMDTATRMAPSGIASPQMSAAIEQAKQPRPQMQTDPQVLDAIHRLMTGGGR